MNPPTSLEPHASTERDQPVANVDPGSIGPGVCVGRYVVVDRIGQGGMGVVYKAYDPQLGRTVALKLLRSTFEDASATRGTIRERLAREARALALLSHPNVINVHDVGTFGDDVFLAMEFVEGTTLDRWLRAEPRSRGEILRVFLAAGEGLLAAHAAGLVHRDFKPENVMVGLDGRVRVLDFGLARANVDSDTDALVGEERRRRLENGDALRVGSPSAEPETPGPSATSYTARATTGNSAPGSFDAALTEAHVLLGTPRYMAPEQHLGHPVDERTDQFSFCVALYEALYEAPPFQGSTVAQHTENVILGRVTPAPAGSHVPRWLRQALLRGLEVEQAARFPSMRALLDALRADPRAAWGRQARWGAGFALALTAAGAWVGANRSQERACRGAARELAGVWDGERRTAIETAFRGGGLPYAESVLATVERAFDEYSRSWTAMNVDACEATHVRRVQSAELLDLRMSCLSDRLTQMKTLSDLFATGDPKVVEHAVESVQSLPRVAACGDVAALRAPVPPPGDAPAAQRVAELRTRIAQASALDAAGKDDEALGLSTAALADAEALGYAPVVAEAAFRLGEIQGNKGLFEDSSRSLYHALVEATAGRDDAIAALSSIGLVQADGARRSQFEEADRWAELAEANVGRLQQRDELLGWLYEQRSVVRRRESKLEEALADIRRSLELRLKVFGPTHHRVANSYHFLGNAYYALGRNREAVDAYQHTIDIEEAEVGPDHPRLASPLIGIANAYGDLGDHSLALSDYQHALAILQRSSPDHPDVGGVYNNVGSELDSLGRSREAIESYDRALAFWGRRLGPSYEVTMVLDNLGGTTLDLGDTAKAMDYYERAYAMGTKVLGADHALCAGALWGIGETYRRQGKLHEAWTYFQRSLPIAEKALGKDHPMLARPLLLGMGLVLEAQGEPARAVEPLERALALDDRDGRPEDLGAIRFALAKAVAAAGDPPRARELAAAARDAYAKVGPRTGTELEEVKAWLARAGAAGAERR